MTNVYFSHDPVPHLLLSPSSLRVAEGADARYTVELSEPPTGSVKVDFRLPPGTDLTLAPASASLTFTTTNWSKAQTVTVSAGEDDDAVNDVTSLLHTASGGGFDAASANVQVVVIDDDATGRGLLVSPPSLAVAEGCSEAICRTCG